MQRKSNLNNTDQISKRIEKHLLFIDFKLFSFTKHKTQ